MAEKHHNRPFPKWKFPVSRSTLAMALFVEGCILEGCLLMISRYLNGTMRQMVLWYRHLLTLGVAGIVIFAIGTVLMIFARRNMPLSSTRSGSTSNRSGGTSSRSGGTSPRTAKFNVKFNARSTKSGANPVKPDAQTFQYAVMSLCALLTMIFGAWTALTGFVCFRNIAAVMVFSALVPAVTVLAVFWCLYNTESALAFTILCAGALCAWLRYRGTYAYPVLSGTLVVMYAAALVVFYLLFRAGRFKRYFPADSLPVPLSCALSFIGILLSLTGVNMAYYAMWGLILSMFGFVVYETVRQL